METNETLETVIKFGVPTLETCKALDWQKETLFVWSNTPMNKMFELLPYCLATEDNFTIPAPQMHEIAYFLPTIDGFVYMKGLASENGVVLDTLEYCNHKKLQTIIRNHHYAQAYAELFIKLRESGLLEKK